MYDYWQRLDSGDKATLEEKVNAIYNVLNNISREMSIGKVPRNKEELERNIKESEARVTAPMSVAFVKMVEKGEIDEITASENANLFIAWDEDSSYNINDLRQYENELYKCIQSHQAQPDWNPAITPSLWKKLGINENGIMEWSQPISSSDAYMTGDEVMYNDVHYRSIIDNNVWSPEAYPQGWEVVEDLIDTPSSGDAI